MHPFIAFILCIGAATFVHSTTIPGHQHDRRQNGPVPPDTIKDCTYFYDSQPGDTCDSIASDWGLDPLQFITYNPSVKSDCTGLVTGNAYCVEENYGQGPKPPETTSSTSTTSKTTGTSTSPAPTGPSPVQSGITTQCERPMNLGDCPR